MGLKRHDMRVLTMGAVYAALIYESVNLKYDPRWLIKKAFGLKYCEIELDFKEAFVKALAHQDEIKTAINEFLDGWVFERLSLVTQAIMLLCYAETVLTKATPKPVAINEAVELARAFVDDGETKYVNAVLERTLSKALNLPSDYKKIKIVKADLELTNPQKAASAGQAVLIAPPPLKED